MTYLVIAYRWGYTNSHHYIVYCGPDKTKAVAMAQAENADRGGKYGCAVYEWDADGTEQTEIAYFGAMMNDENHPFHNYRIDYFETLGHKFDRYAEGFATYVEDHPTLRSKDGSPMQVVVEKPEMPPKWVVDERDNAKMVLDVMSKER